MDELAPTLLTLEDGRTVQCVEEPMPAPTISRTAARGTSDAALASAMHLNRLHGLDGLPRRSKREVEEAEPFAAAPPTMPQDFVRATRDAEVTGLTHALSFNRTHTADPEEMEMSREVPWGFDGANFDTMAVQPKLPSTQRGDAANAEPGPGQGGMPAVSLAAAARGEAGSFRDRRAVRTRSRRGAVTSDPVMVARHAIDPPAADPTVVTEQHGCRHRRRELDLGHVLPVVEGDRVHSVPVVKARVRLTEGMNNKPSIGFRGTGVMRTRTAAHRADDASEATGRRRVAPLPEGVAASRSQMADPAAALRGAASIPVTRDDGTVATFIAENNVERMRRPAHMHVDRAALRSAGANTDDRVDRAADRVPVKRTGPLATGSVLARPMAGGVEEPGHAQHRQHRDRRGPNRGTSMHFVESTFAGERGERLDPIEVRQPRRGALEDGRDAEAARAASVMRFVGQDTRRPAVQSQRPLLPPRPAGNGDGEEVPRVAHTAPIGLPLTPHLMGYSDRVMTE